MKANTTSRRITPMEYRRRVFNKVLTECLVRLNVAILEDTKGQLDPRTLQDVRTFAEAFYADELQLDKKTIAQTRQFLREADEFVQGAMDTAEKIAKDKKATVEEQNMEVTDDQDVELSDEDEEVIDTIFEFKKPDPQIDQIRNATVDALVAEDQKAQEVKQAIEIAQEQEEERPGTMEETVKRLNAIGPTSLMNGLMNYFSTQAVKNINEAGNFNSVSDAMRDNRELIKDRAIIMYSLFETASVMHISKFDRNRVEKLAREFYFAK